MTPYPFNSIRCNARICRNLPDLFRGRDFLRGIVLLRGIVIVARLCLTVIAAMTVGMALTRLTIGMATAFMLSALLATAFVISALVTATFCSILMIAATLAVAMTGTTATATAVLLGTTASGKFGTCSLISLHIVGVVTQLADLLTQLVGIGLLGVVVDGQFGRLHVVGVGFNALEIRHVLLELVGAFLTNAVGLDGYGLLSFGGLLSVRAQRDDGC